jgi:hypothetical protein
MRDVVLWVLVGFQALAALCNVGLIGKKRDPITPLSAVITVIISALFIVALLYIGGRL